MKHFIFTTLILLLCAKANAYEEQKLSIKSEIIAATFEVDVYLPQSYFDEPNKRYPVFVTTAGGSRQDVFIEQLRWLSHVTFAPIPESIAIVLPSLDLSEMEDKYARAGGSNNGIYADVLIREILPALDQSYRTTGYRAVEGFSSFANLALYLLRYHSSEFNAFLLFSPALEIDQSGLLERFNDTWSLSPERQHFVYLSLGTFKGNRPLYQALTESLQDQQSKNQFELVTTDLSEENYLSGPILGLVDASQKLFADLHPDYKQFHDSGIKGVKAYFTSIEDKYLQRVDTDSKLVDLAFSYARAKQIDKAQKVMIQVMANAPENLIYPLRLSQMLIQANRGQQAKEQLKRALVLAKQQNDQEAQQYINSM